MKKMKKLASVALALVMALALMAPAFATEAASGTITLKNPSDTPEGATHTYDVYRVFEMTRSNDGANVSYTVSAGLKTLIEADDTVKGFFTFNTIANDSTKFSVVPAGDYASEDDVTATAAAKTFSEWLNNNKASLTKVTETAVTLTGPNATANVNVPYGYYFVDSTVGSLFMLDSTNANVTITDKNETPTSTKTWDNDALDKQIGDTVNFTITVVAKKGAEGYVVHDMMGNGLTLNANSFAVKVNNVDVATANYTLNTNPEDDCTFEISFTQAYLDAITEDTTIVITYSAVINSDAVTEVVGNKSQLEYGDNKYTPWNGVGGDPKDPDDNKQVFDFDLVKTTNTDEILLGAKFELYRGNEIVNFVKNGNDYTVCAAGTDGAVTTIEAGNVRINGLGAAVYTLKETEAPAGYNKLTEDKTIDMTDKQDKDAEFEGDAYVAETGVQVINETGAVLPSTGGMGTTIFYAVGGVLLAGSVVLFVTKKRLGE